MLLQGVFSTSGSKFLMPRHFCVPLYGVPTILFECLSVCICVYTNDDVVLFMCT
jgi:hypothetical protein